MGHRNTLTSTKSRLENCRWWGELGKNKKQTSKPKPKQPFKLKTFLLGSIHRYLAMTPPAFRVQAGGDSRD